MFFSSLICQEFAYSAPEFQVQRTEASESFLVGEKLKSRFLAALKECSRLRDLRIGRELQLQARECGLLLRDVCIGNSFITMFARCGSMADAQMIFDGLMISQQRRSVVSWNALLHGYLDNGESLRVLELFERMTLELAPAPNSRTYVAALGACASLGAREVGEEAGRWLEKGSVFHSRSENSGCCDMFVESALVDMYSKCGSVLSARRVFDRMARRDVVAWSCLVQGYVENGDFVQALAVFSEMLASGTSPNARTYVSALVACGALGTKWLEKGEEIISRAVRTRCCDIFVETSAIDMFVKCKCLERARALFNKMPRRNIVTWNSMIQGCVENGENDEALELFEAMVEGSECVPDARSFVAALNACACSTIKHPDRKMDWLRRAKSLHSQVLRGSELNTFVENALLNAYLKCGGVSEASVLFDALARRDKFSWSSMIRGFVDNGHPELGLEMFGEMVESGDSSPDPATFVAVLMACGSLTNTKCGRAVHNRVNRCGLEGDITVATCLMELYSRCGGLAGAKQMFDSIADKDTRAWNALMLGYSERGETNGLLVLLEMMVEEGVAPDEVTFIHVLSACSHGGLSERGKDCFDRMEPEFGVKPGIEHYACLVDLLGRGNRVEEALKVIGAMPVEADSVIWHSLLTSCKKWKNASVAEVAYKSLLRLDGRDACTYVSMAQVFEN